MVIDWNNPVKDCRKIWDNDYVNILYIIYGIDWINPARD
jgi:hypothetical protein